ncbi:hypothetical protein F5Y10DRAFT_55634 [Nemania abortiva]|nr:hypothetical protein F5Y10DRAFT_55634 [Nemania abortiva]
MATSGLGLEIAVFGSEGALSAEALGATRIELNAEGSYGEGGLSPSLHDLQQFTRSSKTEPPVRMMIRPRGPPPEAGGESARDFQYSDAEFEMMIASIKEFTDSGTIDAEGGDGFVFGILEEDERGDGDDGTGRRRCRVDKTRCARLVRVAHPFKCVFHRAFDEIVSCDDGAPEGIGHLSWETGLEDVAACGFDGILTSGGLGKAVDNMDMLERIIRKAQALKIEIIVGGGVRTANVGEIIRRLGLREKANSVYLHSACLQGDGSGSINADEAKGIMAQLR